MGAHGAPSFTDCGAKGQNKKAPAVTAGAEIPAVPCSARLHEPERLLDVLHARQRDLQRRGDFGPGLAVIHHLLHLGARLIGDDRAATALAALARATTAAGRPATTAAPTAATTGRR